MGVNLCPGESDGHGNVRAKGDEMPEKAEQVVIVGGGVIGCSVAYYLARHGATPLVLESGRLGALASDAAAGVLFVRTEDQQMRRLAMESFGMFPELTEELIDEAGIDPMYQRLDRVDVALDEAEAVELRGWLGHPAMDGFEHEWLDGDAVRSVEPLLRNGCVGGLHVAESAAISGGMLSHAYAKAAESLGAKVRKGVGEVRLNRSGDRVVGVRLADGREVAAETVVLAAGYWSRELAGAIGVEIDLTPVKGQTVKLRLAGDARMSANVYGPDAILVPRRDGTVIAGFTLEPGLSDLRSTGGGVKAILEHTTALVPSLADAEWLAPQVGLRPQSATGLPLLGPVTGVEGLVLATGHHRVGVALSPITGRLIADHIIDGAEIPADLLPT